jgi:hypothetical protein
MKLTIFAAAVAVVLAAPAHADPTPSPIVPMPGGSWLPGNQVLPPVCGVYMQGCGLRYDPGSGTWQPKG